MIKMEARMDLLKRTISKKKLMKYCKQGEVLTILILEIKNDLISMILKTEFNKLKKSYLILLEKIPKMKR